MKYAKALVTGGAGFIGSHLARELLKTGMDVVILDNLYMGKRENIQEGSEFIEGDILDPGALDKALSGVDIVFHEAARVSIRDSNRGFYEDAQINIMGTLSLLKACIDRKVKKIIYAPSIKFWFQ